MCVCVRRIVLIIALTKSGLVNCPVFLMREAIKTNCYMDTKTVLVRVQKGLSAWTEMKSAEKCG